MLLTRYNLSFFALLIFHFSILIYANNSFSISYGEAKIFFESSGLLGFIINLSTDIFGVNDFGLRLPFILFYIGSAVLLYLLTDDYFKKEWDRIIALSIFMILPGVNSAALLINESIIVVFLTLLYLYLYKVREKEHYIILTLYLFIDNSFAILYLTLFFYSLRKKDNILLVVSLILFGISMSIYGFEIGGWPRAYFLDTFGIYATIFSPLLFFYFFYSVYRVGLKFEKDMYWYISVTALCFSLILSLRQRIDIEDFAPFVVIAIPIMVKLFLHSVRVRLSIFRKYHYRVAGVVLGVLVLNFMIFIFNKYLYLFMENPKKHFAYSYHIAKDLSNELKSIGIKDVNIDDKKMALRLRFYGIDNQNSLLTLSKKKKDDNSKVIEINYHSKVVEKYYLSK